MKTKLKFSLRVACHTLVKVLCVGAILLLAAAGAEAQNLFVAAYGSGQINAFTPAGAQSTFASGLNQPLGLAFDRAGNLYEADASSGNIYKFTPAGARSTFISGLNRPVGLAFNSASNLFVANSGAGQIVQITPGGVSSVFASGLSQPLGLAFDSAGNLFAADGNSGNIYKFTPAGAQSTFASGLSSPFGLAFDNAGNLYEADDGTGNINKFTPAGVKSTFVSGLSSPVGLAFNSAGELFEGDFGSSNIYKFTPAAARSTFASGLSQPAFLAFQSQSGTIVLNCPGDVATNNAPGLCSASVAFAAQATGSPTPTLVYTLNGSVITSPFAFPVGTNVVTCIASNLTGSTSCGFTVLVRDVVPPMINCPSNMVVDTASPNGAVVNFTVTASDQCSPSPRVTSVPPSGSLFPLGQTTVNCTAVDSWGNSNQCSFVITVLPSQSGTIVLTCPGDIVTNNASGGCSASVAFAAQATGSPTPTLVYKLRGSVITSPFPFLVGTNVVTCIASNLTESTSCSFTVLVRDVVPPMIDCPSDMAVAAFSSNGAVVTFTVKAHDQCSPSRPVTSVPRSGSLFPLGQTTVQCTAVDAWGNSNHCSFVITVSLSQAGTDLVNLINYLAGLPIQHGVKNALLVKLKNALSELQHGQISYALELLSAFEHQVSAQTGKKLTFAQGAALAAGANAVISELGGLTKSDDNWGGDSSQMGRVSLQMVPIEGSDGASCILKVNWSGNGVLQTANQPNGPWTDVPTAAAPYWSEVGTSRQFFRVRSP